MLAPVLKTHASKCSVTSHWSAIANVVSACFYPVLLVITWTPISSLSQNLEFLILKRLIFLYLCIVLICYPSAMCSVQAVETIHFITDRLSNFMSCCSSAFNRHRDTIKCL